MGLSIARVFGLFIRPLSLFILVKSQVSGSVTYALVLTFIGIGIIFMNSEAYRAYYLDSSKDKLKAYISTQTTHVFVALPLVLVAYAYSPLDVELIPVVALIVVCEKVYDEHQRRSIVTGEHGLWIWLCCFRYYIPAIIVVNLAYYEVEFLLIGLAWIGISLMGFFALKSKIFNLYTGEAVPKAYFIPNFVSYFNEMLKGKMAYLILYSLIGSLTIQMVRVVLVSYGENVDEVVLLYTMTFAIYPILDALWFTRLRQRWLNEKTIDRKTLVWLFILVVGMVMSVDLQWFLIGTLHDFNPSLYETYVKLILLVSMFLLCSPMAQINYWRLEIVQLFKLELSAIFCTLCLSALISLFHEVSLTWLLVIFYLNRLSFNSLAYWFYK